MEHDENIRQKITEIELKGPSPINWDKTAIWDQLEHKNKPFKKAILIPWYVAASFAIYVLAGTHWFMSKDSLPEKTLTNLSQIQYLYPAPVKIPDADINTILLENERIGALITENQPIVTKEVGRAKKPTPVTIDQREIQKRQTIKTSLPKDHLISESLSVSNSVSKTIKSIDLNKQTKAKRKTLFKTLSIEESHAVKIIQSGYQQTSKLATQKERKSNIKLFKRQQILNSKKVSEKSLSQKIISKRN